MASKTAAQEEFDNILAKASALDNHKHPDDEDDYRFDRENSDIDEDDEYRNKQIEETMKMSVFERSGTGLMGLGGMGEKLRLPHRDFDNGRTTGVKGVIADARSFEEARRGGGKRNRGSTITKQEKRTSFLRDASEDEDEGSGGLSEDEEFLERWRQERRAQMQSEGKDIRNRRTSPSVRRYGRFDEVDAMGYLDAIEKVGRETVVVVFVYDPEVCLAIPIIPCPPSSSHLSLFPHKT